jgi:hypothetical protein
MCVRAPLGVQFRGSASPGEGVEEVGVGEAVRENVDLDGRGDRGEWRTEKRRGHGDQALLRKRVFPFGFT